MFESLRNKRRVDRQFEQIDALNNLINEKTLICRALEEQIDDLAEQILDIRAKYPELEEYDALIKFFAELKKQESALTASIEEKQAELDSLTSKIGVVSELMDIELERTKLQEEQKALETYKKGSYNPEDIIIAAYTVPNINDIAIGAFIYDRKIDYYDDGKNCVGVLYKSLGGGRTAGLNAAYETGLKHEKKATFNCVIKQFVTFEEACLAVGSDLYIKERVSTTEIDSFLKYFRSGFYFYGKTDITLDEFMEMLKAERTQIDASKPLSRLLEKGEPN